MEDRPGGSPPEPRQRWRVAFARSVEASSIGASEEVAAWVTALGATDLPLATSGGAAARPRLLFAAPAPVGVACERELFDVVLTERWTLPAVRARLDRCCPSGRRIVDVHDVWLGEPSPAARLAAADYRLGVRGAPTAGVTAACAALIGASTLRRTRARGEGRKVDYDLRPLLLGLSVVEDASAVAVDVATVWARLRLAQDGPSGRPDELVLALGEAAGHVLTLASTVRERLLTADELVLRPPRVGHEPAASDEV